MSDYPFPEVPEDESSGGTGAVTIDGQPIATTVTGGITLDPGDIEIGAVEIKNGADDTRAIVTTAAPGVNDAGLVVRIAGGAVGGGLTDAQLRATPVPVSGAVTVSDGSGPLTVDGTVAVSGSVAVTGPVTDTQLRATPVPVSGSVTVSDGSGPLTIDGTVAVSGSVAVTGPLTDTQLRATAVPVSGPLTDTQLRATAVPVSGTVTANAGAGPYPVSDNAGSLTVDAPVGTPVFVRLSDGAAPIAALPITDNGGSLTVDGSVTAVQSVTQDYDTSGATLNQPTSGVVVPSATGPIAITGDAANGLDVDVTRVIPGTTSTAIGAAEDDPQIDGKTGVVMLVTRRDSQASGVSADGDYATLSVDSTGSLRTFSNGLTPGTSASNLAKAEDAAHSSGDVGVAALARRIDAEATSAGTSGDYATLDTDALGRLRTVAAPNPVTATLANVAGSASSVTLIAANAARRGWAITNDSTQILYVKLGTTASTSSYYEAIPAATATQIFTLESQPGISYQGDITGIMPSANGNARTTEFVAA